MSGSAVEILAPAGSPDSLFAALESGADAVYLGLQQFNARGNAVNFNVEELSRYVPLAHRMGTRVYLTLNTIVKMDEMTPILQALADLTDIGLDGVILQDIGLGRIIRDYFPGLRRHASTQLAVHNLDGVRFCIDEGFERVVLARELTLKEIAAIRDAFPPDMIELEVFCHGAMCYTYSGMCFFSGSVGGRSGNRGECAYTCRKGYRILNETRFPGAPDPMSLNNYLFSMKDMNTLDVLPQLVDAGVDSLKIEGRRKGPAYVSASVQAYRRRLEGLQTDTLEQDMQLAFSRDTTQAFYQRGQFGDHPIDLTTTGTVGLHIGTIDGDGSFELLAPGIQRYDGIRLVQPNRDETSISFRDYRVDQGDRHQPKRGTRITLKQPFPEGTRVMWVHSQAVDRRYQPDKSLASARQPSGEAPVTMTATRKQGSVSISAATAYASVMASLPLEPSTSGKAVPLRKQMFRFGDTNFLAGSWFGPEEVDGFIPGSKLKQARRDLLAQLAEQHQNARSRSMDDLIASANQSDRVEPVVDGPDHFVMRLDQLDLLEGLLPYAQEHGVGLDVVMRPTLSTPDWQKILSLLAGWQGPLRLVLPMVLRHWDVRVLKHRLTRDAGPFQEVVLSNPGHFSMVRDWLGEDVVKHADFSIYHLNTWARRAMSDLGIDGRLTLSLEDDRPNMEALLAASDPARFETIVYTDTPLFVAEACSLAALYGGCPGAKVCGHETLLIENEHGDRFHVRHDRCRSTVIGDKALAWSGRLDWFRKRGVHHFRADFTVRPYSVAQVKTIMDAVIHNKPVDHTHTENLDRVLL